MKFLKLATIVGAAALLISPSLKADTVLFNFNSLANGAGNGSVSLTLATSDGTTQHLNTKDTFIDNVSSSTAISMTFSGLKIYSVSFDYEIFPDGTCPTGNNCGS